MSETLNGEYEVTLEHPIDEAGKWTQLIEGRILRVPVPRGMTPYVKLADQTIVQDTTSRSVWRTVNRTSVRIISGNGKIIGTINGGERIAVSHHEYFATFTHKTDSTKDYVSRYSNYPTDAVPEGFTRTVAIWYYVVAPSGLSGWVPGYSCSNVYKSHSIKTIVYDVVKSKQLREQPFRIYRVVPELGKVTVYARHIFYDLLDNFIKSYSQGENDRGAEVVKGIGAACRTKTDFKYYSDLTSTVDEFEVENTNPMAKGYWTKGGHYICVWKIDDQYIYANDPASSKRIKQNIDDFKKERKAFFVSGNNEGEQYHEKLFD